MLNPDAARERIVAAMAPVGETEQAPLNEALNRIAAGRVSAPVDLPPFDASAMDGYAVCAGDLPAQPPFELAVVGESAAGHPSPLGVSGLHALRIFTGAALPAQADAVVLQEDVTRQGGRIMVTERPRAGQHVRLRGHDIAKGAVVVRRGSRLDAYALSWLAACGIAEVAVRRRVRVALFATGDELADAGAPLAPGQIYDSNRFALRQLMHDLPVDIDDLGRLPDDRLAIQQALMQAGEAADIIIASGGVSVGDADFVRAAVEQAGALDFWRIALKPGKPLAVGKVGQADFFGLPGNPVSTIVTFLLFAAPAIVARGGGMPQPPLRVPAALAGPVSHTPGRREYQRGALANDGARLIVTPARDQGSNRLATFAGANCLLEVPEHRGDLDAGEVVQVLLLGKDNGLFEHASAHAT